MNKKTVHLIKKIMLTMLFATLSFAMQGCFSDKGGGSQNSILNLSPQQQLHGTIVTLETEKVIYDESKLNNNIAVLDRAATGATGQVKYEIVFFNALYKAFYIDLMFKKGNFKSKQIFELLKASESDLKYFPKSNYRLDDYHLVLGIFNSIRNFIYSNENEKRVVYKRAQKHFDKLFRDKFTYTSDFKVGGVFITQNDVRLMQIENEVRYENPIGAFDYLKKLDAESEEFADKAQYLIKKAQLLYLAGEIKEALDLMNEFKSKKYLRSPYYDEGLWVLRGIYETLSEDDENYSIDIKVVKNQLKECGGFYSKSGVLKLSDYLPKLSETGQALFRASYLYYKSKYKDAVDIMYDLLDYPEAKHHKFKKQDANPDEKIKAHRILLRCYEKMKKIPQEKIDEETALAASEFDTEEIIIDLEKLIEIEKKKRGEVVYDTEEVEAATGEVSLENTAEVNIDPKIDRKVDPKSDIKADTKEVKAGNKSESKAATGAEAANKDAGTNEVKAVTPQKQKSISQKTRELLKKEAMAETAAPVAKAGTLAIIEDTTETPEH
ncbi:MAG: hypothetical protein ACD_47C00293G0001 [uncultured bacterium]|nr:MAG: hypothetical protein ACD_47C00293G0001 [uncultured bacterium]